MWIVKWEPQTSSERTAHQKFDTWVISKFDTPISGRYVYQQCVVIYPKGHPEELRWVPKSSVISYWVCREDDSQKVFPQVYELDV